MKSRKIFALVFSLLLFATSLPLSAFAENSGDFEYYILEDGTAEISNYSGNVKNLEIPSVIDGVKVTSMRYTFSSNKTLETITIPESITNIRTGEFSACSALTSITVAGGNKNFASDNGILYSKDKTALLAYPIGNARTEFSIPNHVTEIGAAAFYNSNLTDILIPNSVRSIEEEAFNWCGELLSITIPSSVEKIGEGALEFNLSLKKITVDEKNKNYSSDAYNVLFNKEKTELIRYPIDNERNEYVIPNSVKTIGDSAFSYCDNLENITIPDGVTTIRKNAFLSCDSLLNLKIPTSVKSIEEQAFSNCDSFTDIFIPNGITKIEDGLFSFCGSLKNITIPKSVTGIGEMAFDFCDSLTDIYYEGTEEEWKAIRIGEDNDSLLAAKIHFNSEGPAVVDPKPQKPAVTNPTELSTETTAAPVETTAAPTTNAPTTTEPTTAANQPSGKIEITDNSIQKIDIEGAEGLNIPFDKKVSEILSGIKNQNAEIADKDGKKLAGDSRVGTNAKLRILDENGEKMSEYQILLKMDTNGDGKVNSSDARIVLRHCARLDLQEGIYALASDSDANGKITSADARLILRKSARLD